MTFSSWVYRSTAEFPVKTGLIKLALHTCSFISSLDDKLQKLKWHELQDDSHLFVFTPCMLDHVESCWLLSRAVFLLGWLLTWAGFFPRQTSSLGWLFFTWAGFLLGLAPY
jgi:hypothetical protein